MSLVEKALKKLHDQRTGGLGAAVRPGNETISDGIATLSPGTRAETPVAPVPRNNKTLTVNPAVLRTAGLLAPEEEQRRIAAEYRQIKRPLIAAAVGRGSTVPVRQLGALPRDCRGGRPARPARRPGRRGGGGVAD